MLSGLPLTWGPWEHDIYPLGRPLKYKGIPGVAPYSVSCSPPHINGTLRQALHHLQCRALRALKVLCLIFSRTLKISASRPE